MTMIAKDKKTDAPSVGLQRQDLIALEPLLRKAVSKFLSYSSYGLYFPAHPPRDMIKSCPDGGQTIFPVYYPSEKKALLPLRRHGELLAIFVARGVPGRISKTVLTLWAALCDQIMDTLLLHKAMRSDQRTGLYNAVWLEESLSREIRLVQRGLWPDTPACLGEGLSEFSASAGLICLDLDGFARINERFGYQFGDRVLRNVADLLRRLAPEQASCARLQEDTLAVCFSGATSVKCRHLAENIAAAVNGLEDENEVTGERVRLSVSQGYATYPQDFHGRQLRKSLREQTGLMLEKALRALRDAREKGGRRITGFAQIVQSSGIVLDLLPMNKILVNLGRSVDAHEGQRFLLWSGPDEDRLSGMSAASDPALGENGRSRFCKGEVQLIEVYSDSSVAEIIMLHDPGYSVQHGDRLSILGPVRRGTLAAETAQEGCDPGHDAQPGLLSSQAFLRHWSETRRGSSRFSLLLAHLDGISAEPEQDGYIRTEHRIRELTGLTKKVLGPDVVLGRFSFSTLGGFIADQDAHEILTKCRDLVRQAKTDLEMAVYLGMAGYPFLNFEKPDILDNCRKALDHALMLPQPCAVEFCSTSLTISADRHFAGRDHFSAMEEYKLALLADESNHLARNSLGVCFARLGRLSEAQTQFARILADNPQDIMASYNQGHTFLKQGEPDRAEEAFVRCLKGDPQHVFSLLRLGQLAEQRGDDDTAQAFFEQAEALPGGKGLTQRHLAKLELRRGNAELAREYLHQALVFNARDAQAMHMLAKMYLEQGEDPEIAEILARQSAAFKPEQNAYWDVLADALAAQGKHELAAQARERRS